MFARRVLAVLAGMVCNVGISTITLDIASFAVGRKVWWAEMLGGWISVLFGAMLAGYLSRRYGWIVGVIVGVGNVTMAIVVWLAIGLPPSRIPFLLWDNPAILLDFGGSMALGAGGGALGSRVYAKIAKRGVSSGKTPPGCVLRNKSVRVGRDTSGCT